MIKDKNIVVDAVITWVDGDDANHKAKMQDFMVNKRSIDSKNVRMRYGQVNEIEFAVKSILKYATFIRNIFIVTDNQTPDFLKDKEIAKKRYPNVYIVDHRVIFKGYEQSLPTFNSISIESLLYKIPDLAEHFLYFNDDFFLLKNTKVDDFFKEGKPIIRGNWKSFYDDIWYKKLNNLFLKIIGKNKTVAYKHKKGLEKPAQFLKFNTFFFTEHTPTAIRKSTLNIFFNENRALLDNNVKHRFRNSSQFVMHSLANHLELKNKTGIVKNDFQLAYFQNYKKPFWWLKNKLKRAENNKNKIFLCMQSLDQCPPKKLAYIKNWLHKKYD